MKTVVIQIGNSDDKLSQAQWSHYFKRVDYVVCRHAKKIYFSGTSFPSDEWQNAAWVLDVDEEPSLRLQDDIKVLCDLFSQDSIAWTEGTTIFIEPKKRSV